MTTLKRFAGRLGSKFLDLLANLLAFVGVVGIIVWLCGTFWGVSVIMFATGSMRPAIPEGAAVLSVNTPAKDLQIGDVITVPLNYGDLPVSHRIVLIEAVDNDPDARMVTLKGDANPVEDSEVHLVKNVPRVAFIVPGGAYLLQFLGDPRMLIAIGLIALGLIIRAFFGHRLERANVVAQPVLTDPTSLVSNPLDPTSLVSNRMVLDPVASFFGHDSTPGSIEWGDDISSTEP